MFVNFIFLLSTTNCLYYTLKYKINCSNKHCNSDDGYQTFCRRCWLYPSASSLSLSICVSSNCPFSCYFIPYWHYVSLILICLSDCDCFHSFLYLVFYFTFGRRYTHGIIRQRYTHGKMKQRNTHGKMKHASFKLTFRNID